MTAPRKHRFSFLWGLTSQEITKALIISDVASPRCSAVHGTREGGSWFLEGHGLRHASGGPVTSGRIQAAQGVACPGASALQSCFPPLHL